MANLLLYTILAALAGLGGGAALAGFLFKNKIKISNIVDNRPVSPEDTVEMSDLINSYIQEIDQLITHLSE